HFQNDTIKAVEEFLHRSGGLFGNENHAHPEKYGKENDLQHIGIFSRCAYDIFRHQIYQSLKRTGFSLLFGPFLNNGRIAPVAVHQFRARALGNRKSRLNDIDDHQANTNRDNRGNNIEDNGPYSHFGKLGNILEIGNPLDQRSENKRNGNEFQDIDKYRSKGFYPITYKLRAT